MASEPNIDLRLLVEVVVLMKPLGKCLDAKHEGVIGLDTSNFAQVLWEHTLLSRGKDRRRYQ